MVEGIQLISQAWLDGLIEAASSNREMGPRPLPEPRHTNETEEKYQSRLQKLALCHDSRILKWSDFEINFEAAWKNLQLQKLSITGSARFTEFQDWLEDLVKWDPNPSRKTLFSKLSVVLLCSQNDEESEGVERIVQAGGGMILTISPTANDFSTLHQQVQEWWSQQTKQRDPVIMKTKLLDTCSTNCRDLIDRLKLDFALSAEKTTNDLLNAVFHTDRSRLVEPPCAHEKGLESHHTLAHEAPLSHSDGHTKRTSQCFLPPSRGNGPSGATIQSPVKSLTTSGGSELPRTLPVLRRRNLIRRTTSRTDEMRMKELQELFENNEVETTEIDALKLQAMIEHSVDYGVTAPQVERQEGNPIPTLNESNDGNAASLNPSSVHQSTNPVKVACKPLLKRKAQDRREPDLSEFLLFPTSSSIDHELSQDSLHHGVAKRPRLDDFSTTQSKDASTNRERLENPEVSPIECPIRKLLQTTSEQSRRGFDANRHSVIPIDVPDESSEEITRKNPKRKRACLRNDAESGETGAELLISEEIDASNPAKKSKHDSDHTLRFNQETSSHKANHDQGHLADCYLKAKVAGKRLTQEEMESNLEFNRLRITKPLLVLKNKPIPSRPIGWDEEDRSENELREMDHWQKREIGHSASKSFFQVKYVHMIRKPPVSSRQRDEIQNDNANRNFKKFKAKNRSTLPCASASPSSRHAIKMETVSLQRGVEGDELFKKSQQPTSHQILSDIEDDDDDQGAPNAFRPSAATNKTHGGPISKSKSQHAVSQTLSENDDTQSSNIKSQPLNSFSRLRNQPVRNSTQLKSTGTKRDKGPTQITQKSHRLELIESGSESDGDELAFKGFSRGR